MSDMRPIGVFDSGMGGLTVLRALRAHLPNEHLVYLGDTARLPYGSKSAETVAAYALQAARHLLRHNVKMLVIACNTATAAGLDALKATFPIPIIGVIEPGAIAGAAATRSNHIGVIATESTVRGNAYARAIHHANPAARVTQVPCPLFVPLTEEGWINGDITEATVRHYLTPLFASDAPDTLVLGCTHFPVLKPIIANVAGPHTTLVDSADTTAHTVATALTTQNITGGGTPGTTRFFATDSPERFARVGGIFFGQPIAPESVELIDMSFQKEVL